MNTITIKNTQRFINLQEKVMHLFASLNSFKENQKPFLMRCAVVYMSVKIGLILLATFTTMAFFITSVTQYLAIEMSRSKALLFASPLTLVIVLKLYFICNVLITYDRSRLIMKSILNRIFLKGKQGMHTLKTTLPADLPPLSLEKVRNR